MPTLFVQHLNLNKKSVNIFHMARILFSIRGRPGAYAVFRGALPFLPC
uniref:Uncharacterized protein n=1 Tax=Podoviridae sp. ctnCN2 TaxID=2825274 RepID=A0A8S5PM82_9CAUD|nr:MAG TPA: hypothetical protein [Podoviridae sp. ctnCN2]